MLKYCVPAAAAAPVIISGVKAAGRNRQGSGNRIGSNPFITALTWDQLSLFTLVLP